MARRCATQVLYYDGGEIHFADCDVYVQAAPGADLTPVRSALGVSKVAEAAGKGPEATMRMVAVPRRNGRPGPSPDPSLFTTSSLPVGYRRGFLTGNFAKGQNHQILLSPARAQEMAALADRAAARYAAPEGRTVRNELCRLAQRCGPDRVAAAANELLGRSELSSVDAFATYLQWGLPSLKERAVQRDKDIRGQRDKLADAGDKIGLLTGAAPAVELLPTGVGVHAIVRICERVFGTITDQERDAAQAVATVATTHGKGSSAYRRAHDALVDQFRARGIDSAAVDGARYVGAQLLAGKLGPVRFVHSSNSVFADGRIQVRAEFPNPKTGKVERLVCSARIDQLPDGKNPMRVSLITVMRPHERTYDLEGLGPSPDTAALRRQGVELPGLDKVSADCLAVLESVIRTIDAAPRTAPPTVP